MSDMGHTSPVIEKYADTFTQVNDPLGSHDHSSQENQAVEEWYLLDQHRIIFVLSKYDGRMWQGQLLEETEWSVSKMRRTLSRMENRGSHYSVPDRQANTRYSAWLDTA